MEPDSMSGKVLLSVFDKLVLGVAAAVVLAHYQGKQVENQRLASVQVAVAQVVTDVLQAHRQEFTRQVSQFTGLIDRMRVQGQADKEQAERIDELRRSIIGSTGMIGTLEKTLKQAEQSSRCGPDVVSQFEESINAASMTAIEGSNREKISTDLDRVSQDYLKVLEYLRCLSVEIVRVELDSVR